MALVPTTTIKLGYKAPEFNLPDTISGKTYSIDELASEKATVLMFICNHCPYVKHVMNGLVKLANDYIPQGIAFIAISSNDAVNYPEDSPEKMKQVATELNFPFPYLYDESQETAMAYHAACTPDFSIFNSELACVYRGQLDDSRPGNGLAVTGKDIRTTLDNLLNGLPVSQYQKPSIGCSIKWK